MCIRDRLYTTYPGLLIGSGYSHSTKAVGDSSIGFYFDHTTGLPVIPGSSVKGVLRSLFELDIKEKKEFTGPKSLKAIQFIIQEILNYEKNNLDLQNILQELDEKKLSLIKQEIFGAQDDEGKDMFFDAVIDFENTRSGKFMGSDFITPHQPKLLKNPTPIQFIKVLPNIGFKFRFTLKDSPNCTSDLKKLIFKHILLTLGIGAKTNVGYGQFITTETHDENNKNKIESEQKNKQGQNQGNENNNTSHQSKEKFIRQNYEAKSKYEKQAELPNNKVKNDSKIVVEENTNWILPEDIVSKKVETLTATVVSSSNGNLKVRVHVQKFSITSNVSGNEQNGSEIQVKVQNVEGSIKNKNLSFKIARIPKN